MGSAKSNLDEKVLIMNIGFNIDKWHARRLLVHSIRSQVLQVPLGCT